MRELQNLLKYFQTMEINKKIEISIPAIGMGLWKAKPDKMLEVFRDYNAETNKIIFRVFVTDRWVMKELIASDAGSFSILYAPKLTQKNEGEIEKSEDGNEEIETKLVIDLTGSDSESDEDSRKAGK